MAVPRTNAGTQQHAGVLRLVGVQRLHRDCFGSEPGDLRSQLSQDLRQRQSGRGDVAGQPQERQPTSGHRCWGLEQAPNECTRTSRARRERSAMHASPSAHSSRLVAGDRGTLDSQQSTPEGKSLRPIGFFCTSCKSFLRQLLHNAEACEMGQYGSGRSDPAMQGFRTRPCGCNASALPLRSSRAGRGSILFSVLHGQTACGSSQPSR